MFGWVFSSIKELLSNIVEISNKIRNGCFGRHCSVLECNTIRNDTITEDNHNFAAVFSSHLPWRCQIGHILNIDEIAILVRRLFEDFFIGDHPLNTNIGDRLNHCWRNGLLAWPHTGWAETKFVFKQVHTSYEMILHILWPCLFIDSNSVLHCPTFHHEQRHDWVVVRCCGQFNLPVSSKFTVHRQNVAHVRMLSIKNVIQISQFIVSVLHEKVDETLISVAGIVCAENIIR